MAARIDPSPPPPDKQLSREEIEKGEADAKYRLKMSKSSTGIPVAKTRRAKS